MSEQGRHYDDAYRLLASLVISAWGGVRGRGYAVLPERWEGDGLGLEQGTPAGIHGGQWLGKWLGEAEDGAGVVVV